ncbi:beta-propeller domain-containing protein [Methanococcus aeolicus]|uniref:beta-propeller domain-containing protein n=1 Tax=Methanococcus aeolicus TaxID=42879 RepID=UPI0021C82CF7|nr:beta-propeller domain-containing protein [Methanococcus aeolicus]UXM84412.1 beta-propeller domain-containing protein [Methanococcus aeolicus]
MKYKIYLIGLLLLFSVFMVSFSGCIKDNGNTHDITINSKEFNIIPANETSFKEFVKKTSSYGYGYNYMVGGMATTQEIMTKSASDSRSSDTIDATNMNTADRYSETNVQVKGIDEADILKTDGNYIYFSPEHNLVYMTIYQPGTNGYGKVYDHTLEKTYIINALPPELSEVIGNIPKNGKLYLQDNNLIIMDYEKIYNYNVSDPKNPKLNWKIDLNNTNYVDSRVYGGKLYLISSKYDIECPIILNNFKIDYNNYYLSIVPDPSYYYADRTYIISSIDVKSGKTVNSIATAGGYDTTIYMSKENIYFTNHIMPNENKLYIEFLKINSNEYFSKSTSDLINQVLNSEIFGDEAKTTQIQIMLEAYFKTLPNEERMNLQNRIQKDYELYLEENWGKLESTGIMKINRDTFEVVSGIVPGKLLNQFSMDEYDNKLRVATTIGDNWRYREKSTNNLYVLDEELNIIGSVKDMGKGERIYAVRFMGDKAYLITYRETDPLYILDLENPENPKITGELKIPGYSTYLHPIGNNKLIGIGRDDDRKLKISLYDVSDYNNPKELDKYKLPEYWSEALYNHHAFLWDEDNSIVVLPVDKHAYMFKIENNTIIMKKDDIHNNYYYYNEVLGSLYINNYIYTFSNNEVHIIDINSWKTVKKIDLINYIDDSKN